MVSAGKSQKTESVGDSVPKINNDLAVGADLAFQQRWWKFEKTVWWIFAAIVLLDVLGCFGRGPVAKARMTTPDGSMNVEFERIERLGTPSLMTIKFGRPAIRDGKIELLVSESLVAELGNQRVVPQPAESKLGEGKILYTFPASAVPATVQFGLQPARAGVADLSLQVPGFAEVQSRIYIMP